MFYNWKDSNNKDAERRSPEDVVGMRRFRTFLENTFWESPGKEDSVEHRSNKDADRIFFPTLHRYNKDAERRSRTKTSSSLSTVFFQQTTFSVVNI